MENTHARRSATAAVSNASASVASAAISVVLSVVLARALGPDEYGRYAYLTYVLALIGALATFGVPLTVLQLATAAFGVGDRERAKRILASGTAMVLAGGVVAAAALLAMTRMSPLWMGALVVGVIGATWINAASVVLGATSRVSTAALIAFLVSLGSLAAGWVVATRGMDGERAFTLLTAQVVVFIPVALLLVGRQWARPLLTLGPVRPYLTRRSLENWVVGVGTLTVFSRLEVLALQHFGTPERVAVYSLAFGLAARMATPIEALLAPLLPSLTTLHEQQEWSRLEAGLRRTTVVLCVVGGMLTAAAVPSVMALATVLYGDRFEGIRLPLLALGPLMLLKCLVLPATTALLASRRQVHLMRSALWALAVDVVLAVALVPWFSVWGAVAANAAAQLTSTHLILGAVFGDRRGALLKSCRNVMVISLVAVVPGAAVAFWQPTVVGAVSAPVISLSLFSVLARLGRVVPVDELHRTAEAFPRWLGRPVSALIRLVFGTP